MKIPYDLKMVIGYLFSYSGDNISYKIQKKGV